MNIGCLSVGIIHCQDNVPPLADLEPRQDGDVQVDLSVHDNPPPPLVNDTNNLIINEGSATTTPPPEPFSCHECINCTSKADFITQVCDAGIKMCYVRLFCIYSFISFFFFRPIENA